MLCPAARLRDTLLLATLNCDPETAMLEISMGAVPEFVKSTDCVALLPTSTLPNSRLLVLADSTPALAEPFPAVAAPV